MNHDIEESEESPLERKLRTKKPGKLASLAMAGAALLGLGMNNATAQEPRLCNLTGTSISAYDGTPTRRGKVANDGRKVRMNDDGQFFNLEVNPEEPIFLRNTKGAPIKDGDGKKRFQKYFNKKTWYDSRIDIDGTTIDGEMQLLGDFYSRIPRFVPDDEGKPLLGEDGHRIPFPIERFNAAHRDWLDGSRIGIMRFASPYVEGRVTPLKAIFERDGSTEMAGKGCNQISICNSIRNALEVVPLLTDGTYNFARQRPNGNWTKPKIRVVDHFEEVIKKEGQIRFRQAENYVSAISLFSNQFNPNGNPYEVVGGVIFYKKENLGSNNYEHELGHIFYAPGHSFPADLDACNRDPFQCGGLMNNNNMDWLDPIMGSIIYHTRLGNYYDKRFQDIDLNPSDNSNNQLE